MKYIQSFLEFLAKVYSLAKPFGRRKLAVVFAVILAQGIFQVVGVTSIFPFLALAASPDSFTKSKVGVWVLDYLPGLSNQTLLLLAGLLALVMLLISNVLMLTGEVVRTRYAELFGHWLRMKLIRRMISNPYSYFLQRNSGELIKKATGDVSGYVRGILSPFLEVIARGLTVFFLLGTLLLVNPLLATGVAVGFGIFYTGVFYFLRNRRNHASDELKRANRGSYREIQQLLGGIKPVKVHGVERSFLERYGTFSFLYACLLKWFPIYNNSPRYLIEPLAFGGIVVYVMYLTLSGGDLSGQLPALGVMALAGYRLIPNFQLLYGSASGITLQLHTLEEVYEEFSLAEEDGQRRSDDFESPRIPIEWEKEIRLDSISFRYSTAPQPTIKELSLTIRKNEFVAFIGETGSGKSTLVDILLGLHWPQSGSIYLDKTVLAFENLRNWRAGIGYVPQDIFLRDDTIAANIAFGKDPRHTDLEQVRKVCEVAQIRKFIEEELADGYQTRVGERGVRLSGGQRQRIGLARALYHQPALLILDEATSALDTKTESALMEAIENLYGKLTLVVIAHRLSTIRKADRIFRLDHGRLAASGTFEELELNSQ